MSSRTIDWSRLTLAFVLGLLPAWNAVQAVAEPVFSGERAFVWLERQVDLGPRVPGTAGNRALRELILATAREAGFAPTTVCLQVTDPLGGDEVEICNVVVTVPAADGRRDDRLWLGAHFDTRPISDRDPDPSRRGLPVPGANDGASGTAVLLHLLELFAEQSPALEVSLLFFDGEDSGQPGSADGFCLGSRYLAATWEAFGSPLAGPRPRGLIVLDMVGETGCEIPQEGYSARYAPEWTAHVFERAAELGVTALVAAPGRAVFDDHVPFLEQGIPAVDLIDFEYEAWHTTADLPAACSAASLEQIGNLLWGLVRQP